MRTWILLISLLAPLAAACTTDNTTDELELDEEASAKADGAAWYKLYTCNAGEAVLDPVQNAPRPPFMHLESATVYRVLAES